MRNITFLLLFLCFLASGQIRTNEVNVEERSDFRVESPSVFKEKITVSPQLEPVNEVSKHALYISPSFNPLVSGKYWTLGARIIMNPAYNVPAGVDETGYKMALDIAGHVTNPDFEGTLFSQIGIRLHHGANTNSGAGTITNVVGLNLKGLESGGTTLINKWSLIQAPSTFNNHFSGNVRIGGSNDLATPPTEKLEVNGNIDLDGDINISGSVTSDLNTTGAISSGGNVTVNGDLEISGEINGTLNTTGTISSGGNVNADGGFYGGTGLEVYGLRGYAGGSRTVTINLRAANKSFHGQFTVTGQQGNLHNEKHIWHGAVTYDHTHNQLNLYTITSQGVNVSVQNNSGQIQLVITSTTSYGLYVVYRGTAMISSGT